MDLFRRFFISSRFKDRGPAKAGVPIRFNLQNVAISEKPLNKNKHNLPYPILDESMNLGPCTGIEF
jgi:hypothetical protein